MATIPEITDRLTAATIKAEAASEIQYQVANGDANTMVPTESGPTPSIKKWYSDLGQELEPMLAGIPARLNKASLVYRTKGEAESSVSGLPEGQIVDAMDVQERYIVQSGALVFVERLRAFKATPLAGAVQRALEDKLSDILFVEDFGAIGDGVLHPLSEKFTSLAMAQVAYPHATSLSQSIDWAATVAAVRSGRTVLRARDKHYMMTDTVVIPDGVDLNCEGVDYWDSYRPNATELPKSDAKGTHWHFVGTGAKTYTCDDLANVLPAKTVNGVTFTFTKFTNEDSVAGSPATPRAFSVGFRLGKNSGLTGCRVIPSYNKLQGYINGTGLSDEWDVGIWALSANDCKVWDVQSVGHWRMAGVLLTEHDNTSSGVRNPERINLLRVWGAGVRGLLVRNAPQYKVTAWTANTVSVEWMPSFCLTRTNKFRIGSTLYNFSGYTFDSGTNSVTLTGVSPAITAAPSAIRAWNIGNNFSNTVMRDSVFSSLDHVSGQNSTTFGLPVAGAAEYDGYPLRNLVHINTAFQTTFDDLNTLWGGAYDLKYVASKHENGELIAYSNTEHPHNTMNLRLNAEDGIYDTSHLSAFTPRSAWIDSYQIPQTFTDGTFILKPLPGKRMEIQNQAAQTLIRTNSSIGELYLKNSNDTSSVQLQDTGFMALRGSTFRWRQSSGTNNDFVVDSTTVTFGLPTRFGAIGRPTADNMYQWGEASFRWSVIFAGTGTINTSDEREKEQWRKQNEAESAAALEIKKAIRAFKFSNSVDEKGNSARWHYGVGAQTVGNIMMSHGLNPHDYAFFCLDKWDDEFEAVYETREIKEIQEVSEDVFELVVTGHEDYDTGERRIITHAGERYGIRYEELIMFILAST